MPTATVLTDAANSGTGVNLLAQMPSAIPAHSTAYAVLTVTGATLPTVTGDLAAWTPEEVPASHTTTGDVWLFSTPVGSADSGAVITGKLSVSQKWDIGIFVVTGDEDHAPVLNQVTSLSGSLTVPAITPVANDCTDVIIAGLIGGSGTGAISVTPPGGFSEVLDDSTATGGNEAATYAAWRTLSGQAGVSQGTTTLSVTPNVRAYVFRLTVKPAPTASANAGPDQTGIRAYSTVFLDGTASAQANLTSFAWVQTAGPTVTINGASTATPTFQAPPVSTVGGADLTFQLTVTDNVGGTSTDTVTIHVLRHTAFFLKSGAAVPIPPVLLRAPIPPPSGTVVLLSDFAQQSAGLYVASGTLDGNNATYKLTPNTSSKVAPGSGTNQYKLIRAGGLNAAGAAKVIIKNLTLEGTDQLPSLNSYGGGVVQYGTGSIVQNVTVTGIPGYSSSPPGETFFWAFFHSDSTTINGLTLDGTRTSDGTIVAATLLGYNYTTGTHVINGLKANNARYGFGLAMFQCAGTYTFTSSDMRNNRKAINLEQSIGGTVYNFNGCDFRGTSSVPYVAQVTSINSSSTVNFRDPVVDSWPLKVNCYSSAALNGANKQLDSDIHLFIGGVDKTGDATKLQITHL